MKGFEPLNHVSIAAVLAGQCIKPTLPHHYNILALPAGLEPATYWLTVSRSTYWTKEAFWQWWRDSNPWTPLREPLPFQGSVLNHSTTSLYLALPAGFEPATYWLTVSRSTCWTKEAILALLAGIEPATHGLTVHRSATELKKHFYFYSGSGSGIWTHGTLSHPTVFKTAALNHSATPLYLALPAGFEPATYWLTVSRSTYWTKEAFLFLAVMEGFEPSNRVSTVAVLAGQCIQPLYHITISGASCRARTCDIWINSPPFYQLN